MRRWLPALSSLVFVLAFGGCAKLAWFTGQTISFCDVRDDPNTYAGETVRLRALISNDNGTISAFSLCSKESWPRATVSLAPEQIAWLTENKLVRGNGTDKLYFADAVIVGRLEPPHNISGYVYEISNATIERVVSRHEFADSEQFLEWTKSNYQ